MKDILLTARRQRIEIMVFLSCMIVAFLLNIISIVVYDTEWTEIYTQLLWVLIIGVFLYGLSVIVRFIGWGIQKALKK